MQDSQKNVSRRDPKTGTFGEKLAARYLVKQGYRIITRNYRTSLGEIDIIAQEGDTLAFIEVKTRLGTHFGPPQVAVDIRKQEKISRVALAYLKQYRIASRSCRFDVVAILKKHKDFQVDLIRNAFDGVASP